LRACDYEIAVGMGKVNEEERKSKQDKPAGLVVVNRF
jgi:hypothetical protein